MESKERSLSDPHHANHTCAFPMGVSPCSLPTVYEGDFTYSAKRKSTCQRKVGGHADPAASIRVIDTSHPQHIIHLKYTLNSIYPKYTTLVYCIHCAVYYILYNGCIHCDIHYVLCTASMYKVCCALYTLQSAAAYTRLYIVQLYSPIILFICCAACYTLHTAWL